MNEIQKLIQKFTSDIQLAIARAAADHLIKVFDPVMRANHGSKPATKVGRRKGPIQLCPAPGCTNRAAPVFGMVCAKHKDLPKATIKKYREARRARVKKAGK